MEKENKQNSTYRMKFYCRNCGCIWFEDIEKGRRAPEMNECPHCGTYEGEPIRKWESLEIEK